MEGYHFGFQSKLIDVYSLSGGNVGLVAFI
jgi:hypothetical protein